MLLDFYGKLLTDKMRRTLELYYFDDLSLTEIADSENISRQGVHDTLKRALKTLEDYENKLGLIDRFSKERDKVTQAVAMLEDGNIEQAKLILTKLDEELVSE